MKNIEKKLKHFLTIWIIIGWGTIFVSALAFIAGFVSGYLGY